MHPVLWLIVGLAVLSIGAEILVRSAVAVAFALRISALVVGLTVVAFGTSAPEMAVSIGAGLDGKGDIALGNVVGSNIFNVLCILGATAAVRPTPVHRQLLRFDVPLMVVLSFVLWGMAGDGTIGRIDGAVLTGGLLCYVVWSVRAGRREQAGIEAVAVAAGAPAAPAANAAGGSEAPAPRMPAMPGRSLAAPLLGIVVGLGLLVWGAGAFVDSAILLARLLGVPELVIGLTIVAAGTSLPEVAASIAAAVRGQPDLAVGNVVGSNIFNLLAVLGAAAVVAPAGIPVAPAALRFDIPVMLVVVAVCLPIFWSHRTITRGEGVLLLAWMVVYFAAQVESARAPNGALPDPFVALVLWGAVPASLLFVAWSGWQSWNRGLRDGQ